MFDEIITAKLNYCIEHIDAIDKYTVNADNSDRFVLLNDGMNFD